MSKPKPEILQPLVTTYLQMLSHLELRNADHGLRNKHLEVRELKPNWVFNREMYFRVGEEWKWIDKRPWTDEQWKEYANNPKVRTFGGYYEDEVAGYFELLRSASSTPRSQRSEITGQIRTEEVEIAYFGLLPEFIGRGLGGALLTSAIENAWEWSPTPARVWVHTCNRDHPSAMNNYKARGFRVYKVE